MYIDQSVYPDYDAAPETLSGDEEKADYVHRICGQWDYGIVPERATFDLFGSWKDIFDRFPISGSAAYHAFRSYFGWEPVAGRILRATYQIYDLQEGRTDPCEDMI